MDIDRLKYLLKDYYLIEETLKVYNLKFLFDRYSLYELKKIVDSKTNQVFRLKHKLRIKRKVRISQHELIECIFDRKIPYPEDIFDDRQYEQHLIKQLKSTVLIEGCRIIIVTDNTEIINTLKEIYFEELKRLHKKYIEKNIL